MEPSEVVRQAVGRTASRLRMLRTLPALLRVGLWGIAVELGAALVRRLGLIHVPGWFFGLIAGAAVVVLVVAAVRAAGRVTLVGTAKLIDDRLGLKDRLTSALYFARHASPEPMMEAAMADAASSARGLDATGVETLRWPAATVPLVACVLLAAAALVGPAGVQGVMHVLRGGPKGPVAEEAREKARTGGQDTDNELGTAGLTPADASEGTGGLQKIEGGDEAPPSEEPGRTQPWEPDVDMTDEDWTKLGQLTPKELEQLTQGFTEKDKDREREREAARSREPLKMAPLDKDLIQDIIHSEKQKVKGGGSDEEDRALAIPIKSSKPGPAAKGPRVRGGGHGGGDSGESGDTRMQPRRVRIDGRAKVLVESLRSKDRVDKTDAPRTVMPPLMMKFSLEGVEVTAASRAADKRFAAVGPAETPTEEIPLGMQRYVQRYFDWVEQLLKPPEQ